MDNSNVDKGGSEQSPPLPGERERPVISAPANQLSCGSAGKRTATQRHGHKHQDVDDNNRVGYRKRNFTTRQWRHITHHSEHTCETWLKEEEGDHAHGDYRSPCALVPGTGRLQEFRHIAGGLTLRL